MTIRRYAVLLLKYGLMAVALLLTAGASATITMRAILASQEVVVPSLIQKRIAEAGALSSRENLLVKVEGRRNDARVAADRIVAQEPTPGARLKTHRSIRVWLSLGPRRERVPAVEGQALRTARLALEQAQVPLARTAEVDDPAEEGTILVQRPPSWRPCAYG